MSDSPIALGDFDFSYPDELVAQEPICPRGASRLLALLQNGRTEETQFGDLKKYLRSGDLLLLNTTKVLKARVEAKRATGGRVELLFERSLEVHPDGTSTWLSLARPAKALKEGAELECGEYRLKVGGRQGMFVEIRLPLPAEEFFPRFGALPLPPYIQRDATAADDIRYQPVFAKEIGAVAAPTASLHFTEAHLLELASAGIESAPLVLHVGSGTFLPVRRENAEDVRQHSMHHERYEIPEETIKKIAKAKASGGRVVAVGTTAVRALESFATTDLKIGDTNLFIYPGYEFQLVDAMITNFHQPRTTLLMMVSAFAGRDRVLSAYNQAIASNFRLFSYGDAMFLERPESE